MKEVALIYPLNKNNSAMDILRHHSASPGIEKSLDFLTLETNKIDQSVKLFFNTTQGKYFISFKKGQEVEKIGFGEDYLEDLAGTEKCKVETIGKIKDIVEIINKNYDSTNDLLRMETLKYLKNSYDENPLGFTSCENIAEALKISPELVKVNVRYLEQKHFVEVKWTPQGASFMTRLNSEGIDYLTQAEEKKLFANNFSCGPLGNPTCSQKGSIEQDFSEKNIFFDIPYVGYERREEVLREVTKVAQLNAVVAKDKLTSNVVLCKVCRIIQTCKYGLADISFGRQSVTYELGLIHGFGKKVCILLQEGSGKFTDIHGLEHTSYKGERELKIKLAKWLMQNAVEANEQSVKKFIKEQETELQDKGEITFPVITLKKTSVDDFEKQTEKSKKYSENRFNIIKSQINNSKFFLISATPIPLKDDILDVGEKEIQDILLHPSYDRRSGWNMDFTDYQENIKPIFEGFEKNSGDLSLKLFRNGYLEFQAVVDLHFSWSQDEEEFKTSPRFNPYAIIEYPVSFIRLVKELIEKRNLTKSYVIRMSYLNCGAYKLRPYSIETMGYLLKHNERSATLDNWVYEKVFEELDMSNDKEAFIFIERLYNTFGHLKDKIPFFDESLIFKMKKES